MPFAVLFHAAAVFTFRLRDATPLMPLAAMPDAAIDTLRARQHTIFAADISPRHYRFHAMLRRCRHYFRLLYLPRLLFSAAAIILPYYAMLSLISIFSRHYIFIISLSALLRHVSFSRHAIHYHFITPFLHHLSFTPFRLCRRAAIIISFCAMPPLRLSACHAAMLTLLPLRR